MSDEKHDEMGYPSSYTPLFYQDEMGGGGGEAALFPFFTGNLNQPSAAAAAAVVAAPSCNFSTSGYDPSSSSYMSFTDCLQATSADDYNTLSGAFDLSTCDDHKYNNNNNTSCCSSLLFKAKPKAGNAGAGEASQTAISSVSSSSSEAGVEEESSKSNTTDLQTKGCENEDEKSKKT